MGPPIYNPINLKKGAPRLDIDGLEGSHRQVLSDPSGKWYWVMTAEGEAARSQAKFLKMSEEPIERSDKGSTMLCHESKKPRPQWDVPVIAPAMFDFEKRATTFLEVDRPVEFIKGR